MGPGADAEVFVVAPIAEIVAALVTQRSMIGHLIGRKSGSLAHLLSNVVEPGDGIGAGHGQRSPITRTREGSLGLDRELVERDVAARKSQTFG